MRYMEDPGQKELFDFFEQISKVWLRRIRNCVHHLDTMARSHYYCLVSIVRCLFFLTKRLIMRTLLLLAW